MTATDVLFRFSFDDDLVDDDFKELEMGEWRYAWRGSEPLSTLTMALAMSLLFFVRPLVVGTVDPTRRSDDADCTAPVASYRNDESIIWREPRVWRQRGEDEDVAGASTGLSQKCTVPRRLDAGLCVFISSLTTRVEPDEWEQVKCTPSFLIIGAQKSGSTEIVNILSAHPQLLRTKEGELRFLHTLSNMSDADFWRRYASLFPSQFYGRGRGPQQGDEVDKEAGSARPGRRQGARLRYTFEKSPQYLDMPLQAIERVRRLFPSIRLVLLLRDPIDRMMSNFRVTCLPQGIKFQNKMSGPLIELKGSREVQLLRHGDQPPSKPFSRLHCNGDNFERLVIDVRGRVRDYDPTVRGYLGTSTYVRGLSRWLSVFPRNQLHVIFFSQLFGIDTGSANLQALSNFLGLNVPFDFMIFLRVSSVETLQVSCPNPGHWSRLYLMHDFP